jgi:hypothetical protein
VAIYYKYAGTKDGVNDPMSVIVPVDKFKTSLKSTMHNILALSAVTNGNFGWTRNVFYASDTTIVFDTGYKQNAASSSGDICVPTEILGLNELKYKPDDYIVTNGTFTIASLNTPVTVTIGFKPKKLTAWRVSATNNFESFTYDDSISTTSYTRMQVVSGSNINGGTRNIGQSQTNDLISINNDGFTLASGVVTGTWNYFATGVAE